MTDATYTNIDANTLNAKKINASKICAGKLVLDDDNVDLNIKTTHKKIKEMYESNQNTNCFTDIFQIFLNCLYNVVENDTRNMEINLKNTLYLNAKDGVYFNIIDDIDFSKIPEGKGVWCFSKKYGMIFKYKKNGKMYITYGNTCEWKLPVSLEIIDDNVSVSINTI